ncbi:MAG: hypothetical protein RMX65_004865 [Nostoc sp. DedQUE01]
MADIFGGEGNDILTGSNSNDRLTGGAGNDIINVLTCPQKWF